MRSVRKRIGLLALVVALGLVAGLLRPGAPVEQGEAHFLSPGGIAALPTFMPALLVPLAPESGVDQILPAVAPASGPGSFAIVTAICEDRCPQDAAGNSAVTFTMSKVFPPGEAVAATFTASGDQKLVCTDDAACDLTDPTWEGIAPSGYVPVQHVAVGLTGGGRNEVIDVTACQADGDCRSVQVAFVETVLVVPPLEAASGASPILVSYKCDDDNIGRYTALGVDPGNGMVAPPVWGPAFATPEVSWEEVFDWFFAPAGQAFPTAMLRRDADRPFYSCGGDTSSAVDDRVTFETDAGIYSVDWLGDLGALIAALPTGDFFRPWGSLSPACDAGDSVDIMDGPGPIVSNWLTRGGIFPPTGGVDAVPSQFCDVNFAPDGVVTYTLVGMGEAGTASLTTQQAGGNGTVRTANASFTGLPSLSLILESPPVIDAEGGEFTVAIVDSGLRPAGGQAVSCSAEPKNAVLKIVPQTGTSGGIFDPNPGQVAFTLYPTRGAVLEGVDVTVTCIVDSNPDVKAIAKVGIGTPQETVDLLSGCNFVTWTGGETSPADLAERVAPAKNLVGLWAQQPSPEWKGFAPEFPEVSDMGPVSQLDIIAVCMDAKGTFERPVL
jgi:hypothetical protein